MVHQGVDSGQDDTRCGRWSYLTYAAKEGKKVAIVSECRVCKQTNPGDLTSSKQQLGIMYKYEELRPYLLDPHKQTLKATGHEVLVLMDVNQAEEQTYQPQSHNVTLVTKKGFHVDSAIGVYLQSFMQNGGLINILQQMHEGVVPNTHARGYVQIDFRLITSRLAERVLDIRLLNRSALQSDNSGMLVDLSTECIFGKHPDKLDPHKFRNLKLDDPTLSEKYRKILHKQFEQHNVYRRVKKISMRGKDST
jgi:hypothetical protein